MRISANLASLTAQRVYSQTQLSVEKAMQQLASGTRFSTPGIDAAGYAISEHMKAQIKGFSAARMNAENATSFVQLAEGALNEQGNILTRMRELSIQAASDTFSDKEREFLNYEFQQLVQEFDRVARTTKFGSHALLDGTNTSYEFHVGVHKGADNIVKYTNDTNTTASNLGISGMSVEDKDDARDTLETIDSALVAINGSRAKLGAIQSRMDSAINHIDSQQVNLTQAHSKMADTDVPQAITDVRRGQVLLQYQAAMMAAANDQTQNLLRLIA
jgi:flagellin